MLDKIKQKLGKWITAGLLGTALATAPMAQPEAKPIVKITGLIKEDPMLRGELIVPGLPLDSDIYATWEHTKDSDFYLLRAQSLPIGTDHFKVGAAVQHVDGTGFDAHQEAGLVARLQGDIAKDTFGKIDVQYFPTRQEFDTYGFVDSKHVFADVLASYSPAKGSYFVRPGIDAKISDHVLLGLEAMFSGKDSAPKFDYLGARVGVDF